MRLPLFALAALCVSSLPAHADTVFNIVGVLQYGQVSGTLTLNSSSTAFDAIDISVTDGSYQETETAIIQQNEYTTGAYLVRGPGNDPLLFLPILTLTNYQGGPLDSLTFNTGSVESSVHDPYVVSSLDFFVSGSLVPVSATAVTPEPSSIALLGTGILGLAGVVRKRFA